jgi:predicted RNase H-like HicB family nuclease
MKMDFIKNGQRLRLKAEAHGSENEEYKFMIEFYVFKEGENYIAYCPSLDLSTSAKTFNEAPLNFYEMFQLYVESCVDSKTLQLDLLAHGWRMKKETIEAPKFMVLMRKPEMKKLMQAGIGYEKMVVPVSIPSFA